LVETVFKYTLLNVERTTEFPDKDCITWKCSFEAPACPVVLLERAPEFAGKGHKPVTTHTTSPGKISWSKVNGDVEKDLGEVEDRLCHAVLQDGWRVVRVGICSGSRERRWWRKEDPLEAL
jgi:hypothetical protein